MSELRMYKYPLFDTQHLAFDDTVTVMAPPNLGIAHVEMQGGIVTLWSLVDINMIPIKRRFHIAGTGDVLPKEPCYLGTIFDRQFVWHIFELFEAQP